MSKLTDWTGRHEVAIGSRVRVRERGWGRTTATVRNINSDGYAEIEIRKSTHNVWAPGNRTIVGVWFLEVLPHAF